MAEVEARLGYTVNAGNFESVRADFMFRDTVREDETTDQAQRRVYDHVERELISKLEELLAEVESVKHKDK